MEYNEIKKSLYEMYKSLRGFQNPPMFRKNGEHVIMYVFGKEKKKEIEKEVERLFPNKEIKLVFNPAQYLERRAEKAENIAKHASNMLNKMIEK